MKALVLFGIFSFGAVAGTFRTTADWMLFGKSIDLANPPQLVGGRELEVPKKQRLCCAFGFNIYAKGLPGKFPNTAPPQKLFSRHVYGGSVFGEPNGLVYTLRGGFIDTGHMRDYADLTAYLAQWLEKNWNELAELNLNAQGTKKLFLRMRAIYSKPDRETMIRIAQRVAYEYSLWHEIATWTGFRVVSFFSERVSAFTPEDLYSNLLGTYIGAQALRRGDYQSSIVSAMARAMGVLNTRSEEETRLALKLVSPRWWRRDRAIQDTDMVVKRNLGEKDQVFPWLVESFRPSNPGERLEGAIPLEIPRLGTHGELLSDYYEFVFLIDPKQIYKLEGEGTIFYSEDFPELVDIIRGSIIERLGPNADRP